MTDQPKFTDLEKAAYAAALTGQLVAQRMFCSGSCKPTPLSYWDSDDNYYGFAVFEDCYGSTVFLTEDPDDIESALSEDYHRLLEPVPVFFYSTATTDVLQDIAKAVVAVAAGEASIPETSIGVDEANCAGIIAAAAANTNKAA